MPQTIRAVLVGCGGITSTWIKALQDMDNVELVGFVDLAEAAAATRAKEWSRGDPLITTDLAEALDTLNPDVVFNCTIPAAHRDVTLAALEHGCHVLSEKPLADSMENARVLIEAAEKAGRLFAVMQNRRYDPQIRRMGVLCRGGRLGDLTTLNSDFYIGAHFGGFRDHMQHVLLLDMAIHTFDQARFISGADPVSVYCYEWNPQGSWYDQDASAVAIFTMSDGLVYTYRGSWCAEGMNTTWECDWRGVGTQGSALWDGATSFRAEAVLRAEGFRYEMEPLEVPASPEPEKQGGHAGCIREFLDCVRNGGVPETIASDNIKSLAMVLGAIESAETGRSVEIKL